FENDIGTMIANGATRNSATIAASRSGTWRATVVIMTSSPQPIQTGKTVVDAEQDERRREQDDRDRRGEAPGQQILDLLADQLRDHHILGRPEQDRRDVEAQTHREHENAAIDHA